MSLMPLESAPFEQVLDAGIEASAILAVIPALNEALHIETCVRSLMAGSPRLKQVPLTIADGGSTDGTVAIVERLQREFPNLRLLHNPKRLQSAALNLAVAEHATPATRMLVRCDAHSVYPENFILDIAQSLATSGAASVVTAMDAVGHTCFEKGNAWIVDTPLGSGGSAHRGGKVSGWVDHGHHAGFDLSWFREIGGYDETFSHNEDAEYDSRLIQSGGRIFLDAGIRIEYRPRGSVVRLWKQYRAYGRGRARNARKHGTPLKLRQWIPILVLFGWTLGLIGCVFYWPAIILPLGYLSLLIGASIFITLKHRSFCGLTAGVAAATLQTGWAVGYLEERLKG